MADPENTLGRAQRPPKFPIEETWNEMDAFLARCRAAGAPKTPEELAKRNAEFLEIEKRRVEHRNHVLRNEPPRQKSEQKSE